ncbi:MAG: HAD-IA family hydrolase [Planctomycetes bacterium]|nr:HAD-IA family hydrolase [Planctomycetota bacterium]
MRAPRPYQWIAFDAVGTVIRPQPAAAEVYHQIASRFGSQISAPEVTRRFRQAFHDSEQGDASLPPNVRLATSETNEYQRWQKIVATVLDDLPDIGPCFEALFRHFGLPESWRCFDEVAEVLTALQSKGYQIALASNFDKRLHSVCDGLPALRDIGVRVISSEVGYRKPAPGFYDALLAATKCPPEQILMVGDDYTNDVVGARAAGLPAVMVNRRSSPAPDELSNLRELLPRLEL